MTISKPNKIAPAIINPLPQFSPLPFKIAPKMIVITGNPVPTHATYSDARILEYQSPPPWIVLNNKTNDKKSKSPLKTSVTILPALSPPLPDVLTFLGLIGRAPYSFEYGLEYGFVYGFE